MTERKPPEISFASWIDQQINEAAERGAFDNLPGAGKPLPKRGEAGDGEAWLRDYLRREGVSAEELLPTPLRLRKEVERLTGTVQDLRSEQDVREVVAGLNQRISPVAPDPGGPAGVPAACRRRDNDRPMAGRAPRAVLPGARCPRHELPASSMVVSPRPPERMKRGAQEAAFVMNHPAGTLVTPVTVGRVANLPPSVSQ